MNIYLWYMHLGDICILILIYMLINGQVATQPFRTYAKLYAIYNVLYIHLHFLIYDVGRANVNGHWGMQGCNDQNLRGYSLLLIVSAMKYHFIGRTQL